jgi:hypothetical protein
MTSAIPLYVCAAIILSTIVVVAVTSTGLHHTPFCVLPSLGITLMSWMAYPPAQQLSPIVGLLFWVVISLLIYYFPQSQQRSETSHLPLRRDDDLLDKFFKETPSYDR